MCLPPLQVEDCAPFGGHWQQLQVAAAAAAHAIPLLLLLLLLLFPRAAQVAATYGTACTSN